MQKLHKNRNQRYSLNSVLPMIPTFHKPIRLRIKIPATFLWLLIISILSWVKLKNPNQMNMFRNLQTLPNYPNANSLCLYTELLHFPMFTPCVSMATAKLVEDCVLIVVEISNPKTWMTQLWTCHNGQHCRIIGCWKDTGSFSNLLITHLDHTSNSSHYPQCQDLNCGCDIRLSYEVSLISSCPGKPENSWVSERWNAQLQHHVQGNG